MQLKSNMNHSFSSIPSTNVPRSSFNRSHRHLTSIKAGDLVPVFCDLMYPGDTANLSATIFGRLSTPLFPIMDNLMVDIHFFSVPLRLVWDNFQKFMGERKNPTDSIDFLVPQVVSPVGGWQDGTLYDYLGYPTDVAGLSVSALPTRCVNLIWNEWYRDQNLQTAAVVHTDDGPDTTTDYILRKRGKRHDYFTSCLPEPQKGDPVTLPLGTSAPVTGIGTGNQAYGAGPAGSYQTDGAAVASYATYKGTSIGGANNELRVEQDPNNPGYPNIRVNLTEATAATINSLRTAIAIQEVLERDMRGGTRYFESNLAHFGVAGAGLSLLMRPEFLGGGTTNVNFHPVPQQSETGTTPQGNLAAFATFVARNAGFVKSFTEHCYVLAFISMRADLTYQQGLERIHSYRTRYDFYLPEFAHLGEQAVLNKEIFAQGTSADSEVFGYQERWAEMRYKNSLVTGAFRSNHPYSLDGWVLTQDFATLPELNSTFIEENPPMSRVLAVSYSDAFMDIAFNYIHARPMPTYSVPGLGGRL